MTKRIFEAIPRLTVKGEALYQLSQAAAGAHDMGVLRLAADVVDRENITLGAQVFELVAMSLDTTANSTVLDSTSANDVVETIAAHGLSVGAILRCENEFLRVKSVESVNTVKLSRGYAGSTIASHTDGTDIFKKGAAALEAGTVSLPIGVTLTPAAAGPQIATGMTALNSGGFTAVYSTNGLYVSRPAGDAAVSVAENLSGVNNAWEATTFRGGLAPGETKWAISARVPTATDVALGVMRFTFPFAPKFVRISVQTAATLAAIAWDGGRSLSGNSIIITNAGAVDWAATDLVTVEVHGN